MESIVSIIVAIIASGAGSAIVTNYLNRRKNKAETASIQADITKKVQDCLVEAIDQYEKRIDRYVGRIEELERCDRESEKEIRRLNRKVNNLENLFESVLTGAWTLYRQLQEEGATPLYTPPKSSISKGE